MKKNISNALCLTFLFLFICSLLGCATYQGGRFYSGLPLPKNEVALVYAVLGCNIHGILDEREKEEKFLFCNSYGPSKMLELLPGKYNTGMMYETYNSKGSGLRLDLNLQASNIYIIYPEIWHKGGMVWRPIIVNINDYTVEECNKYNGRGSCPDKDKIREWATEYLQGERRILSYVPFNTPKIQGKRVFNGCWQ
jgi:hypothetical protein